MKSIDVLRTFAALSGNPTPAKTDVVDAATFAWVSNGALGFFGDKGTKAGVVRRFPSPQGVPYGAAAQNRQLDRLVAQAALHAGEQLLYLGWAWFSGTVEVDGKVTQFCFPAIRLPMQRRRVDELDGTAAKAGLAAGLDRASAALGGLVSNRSVVDMEASGDAEVTDLIEDELVASDFLERAHFGEGKLFDRYDENQALRSTDSLIADLPELTQWCADVAAAVGFTEAPTLVPQTTLPTTTRTQAGISLHLGCGLYLDQPASQGSRRSSLINLSTITDLSGTAFAKMYGESDIEPHVERKVAAYRPLSQRQLRIAGRVSGADIAALSGAPGTGKSHVLSVIARDAVARGESVLVVAGSPHAVDVLVEHFAETPGPTPVTFGGSRYGQRLAAELSELISRNEVPTQTSGDADRYSSVDASARRSLSLESEALRINADPSYRIEVVAEVDRAGDLGELRQQIKRVKKPGIFKLGHKKRVAAVTARLGVDAESASDEQIDARFDEIEISRDALRIIAAGGNSLSPRLDDLYQNEAIAAKARGRNVTDAWIKGLGRDEKRTLAQISSAVTSNRSARRKALASLDPVALTKAAPLWVGSVRDVDEVLPAVPGLFDVVIFDEAAQIDQLNAASALVRAKRAVVCGDPNQLPHTSYVSHKAVEEAAKDFGTDPHLLNPRSVSTFDIAASQVPVEVLDEHFRSAPHLIEFSARRFYGGDLHVSTRHPSNEAADHIDVTVVNGARDADKVNHAEVAECLRLVDVYAASGWRSIGLISPFRAQADALEAAVLERYRLEEIDAYGLRVGTVHSYQGDERDVLIMSLAVGADEADSAWRFVNQNSLFNVMVTRARQQVMIVTSREDPPGLVGEYLQWSEPLEAIIDDAPIDDPWIRRVAEALSEQGVPVRTGYRVGRHVIDIVAGSGEHAVAIECGPHRDGPDTHMDRAMMLRRAGWKTADAYQTMWSDNPGQFAIELRSRFPKLSD